MIAKYASLLKKYDDIKIPDNTAKNHEHGKKGETMFSEKKYTGNNELLKSLIIGSKHSGAIFYTYNSTEYMIRPIEHYNSEPGILTPKNEYTSITDLMTDSGVDVEIRNIYDYQKSINSVERVMDTLSSYVNVDFLNSNDPAVSYLQIFGAKGITYTPDDEDYSGFASFPETYNVGGYLLLQVEYNPRPEREANPEIDPVIDGIGHRDRFTLHELMHTLGLAHPKDSGGGTPVMNTDYDLLRNTAMTYNYHPFNDYGGAYTPMAFDIAALREVYGLRSRATTDTMYNIIDDGDTLIDDPNGGQVAIGRAYYCISDLGGNDTISAEGANQRALINLNPATLSTSDASWSQSLFDMMKSSKTWSSLHNDVKAEFSNFKLTAGGGLSTLFSEQGIRLGGYTIANHSLIEKAIGSDNDDIIIGNMGWSNELHGGKGNDTIIGGRGKDMIYGGDGDDEIFGGGGDDIIFGGNGADTIHLAWGNSGARVYGGAGNDTFVVNSESMYTRAQILGGSGHDTILFKNTDKSLLKFSDALSGKFINAETYITFSGIDEFKFDDGTSITYSQILNSAYYQHELPEGFENHETFNGSWKVVSLAHSTSDGSRVKVFSATIPDNIDGDRVFISSNLPADSKYEIVLNGRTVDIFRIGEPFENFHDKIQVAITTERDVIDHNGVPRVEFDYHHLDAAFVTSKLIQSDAPGIVGGDNMVSGTHGWMGPTMFGYKFDVTGHKDTSKFYYEVIGEDAEEFFFWSDSPQYLTNRNNSLTIHGKTITIRATDGEVEYYKDVRIELDMSYEFAPEVTFIDQSEEFLFQSGAVLGTIKGRDFFGGDNYGEWNHSSIKLSAEIIDATSPDASVYIENGVLKLGWTPTAQENGTTIRIRVVATDRTLLTDEKIVEFTLNKPPVGIIGPETVNGGYTDTISGTEFFIDGNPTSAGVTWSIINDHNGKFSISPSGVVSSNGSIDFTYIKQYEIVIRGFDGTSEFYKTVKFVPLDFVDEIKGTPNEDILFDTWRSDIIHAGDGDDLIHVSRNFDYVYGEDGNDTIIASVIGHFDGGNGNDTFDISNVAPVGTQTGVIEGGTGHDVIYIHDLTKTSFSNSSGMFNLMINGFKVSGVEEFRVGWEKDSNGTWHEITNSQTLSYWDLFGKAVEGQIEGFNTGWKNISVAAVDEPLEQTGDIVVFQGELKTALPNGIVISDAMVTINGINYAAQVTVLNEVYTVTLPKFFITDVSQNTIFEGGIYSKDTNGVFFKQVGFTGLIRDIYDLHNAPTLIIGDTVLDASEIDILDPYQFSVDNFNQDKPMTWSISGSGSEFFTISNDGVLSSVGTLDFALPYNLVIQATDGFKTVIKYVNVEAYSPVNIIWGTNGDDILYGSAQDDIIYGLEGDDTIYAGGGFDVVYGGAGNDTLIATDFYADLYGEDGDDILIGSHRGDYLYGGNGNDILYGGGHKDRMWGGAGADIFVYKDVTDSDYWDLDLSDRIFDLEDDDAFDFTEMGEISFDWDNGPAGSLYVEVNWQPNKDYGFLSIDVDRDGEFDMAIDFDAGAAGLTQINFVNGPTYYLNSVTNFRSASTTSARYNDEDLFALPVADNHPVVEPQHYWAA